METSKDISQQANLREKVCTKCQQAKSLEEFRLKPYPPKNHRSICRRCEALQRAPRRKYEKSRAASLAVRDRSALRARLAERGLTEEAYTTMLELQKSVCAICGQSEKILDKSGKTRRLAIDHDHKTGKVRGLLCNRCNRALGMLEDDTELINKLSEYVLRNT